MTDAASDVARPQPTLSMPGASAGTSDGQPSGPNAQDAGFSRRAYLVAFFSGLLFFGLNESFLLSGDSALYADYALNAKFDEIGVHYGYYRVIWLLDRTLGAWLHIPMHEMMAHLNVVSGALTLVVSLALARVLLHDKRYAVLAVICFAVCGRVVTNATTSEIYMLQTLVVLTSFLLFAQRREYLAGIVAGLAFYVSPLSVFAYLFFPVFDWQREGRVRVAMLVQLAAIAFLTYLPFLVVHWYDMLWGVRGLLAISGSVAIRPTVVLVTFPTYQFKQYTLLLLFLLPVVWAWRREKQLLALAALVFLPHFYVISKLTFENNTFILTTDLFFACCLAAGARVLATHRSTRYLPPLILAGHLAIMLWTRTFFSFENHRRDPEELGSLVRTYLQGKDAVLITDWNQSIGLAYFGRPGVRGPVSEDPLFSQIVDISKGPVDPARINGPTIYVLETWSASGLARLFRSDQALERIRKQHSWRALAKKYLDLDCAERVPHGTRELYRCTRGRMPTRS